MKTGLGPWGPWEFSHLETEGSSGCRRQPACERAAFCGPQAQEELEKLEPQTGPLKIPSLLHGDVPDVIVTNWSRQERWHSESVAF